MQSARQKHTTARRNLTHQLSTSSMTAAPGRASRSPAVVSLYHACVPNSRYSPQMCYPFQRSTGEYDQWRQYVIIDPFCWQRDTPGLLSGHRATQVSNSSSRSCRSPSHFKSPQVSSRTHTKSPPPQSSYRAKLNLVPPKNSLSIR